MSTKVSLICKKCHVKFEVYKSRANTASYCSLDCKYSAESKHEHITFNGNKYFLTKRKDYYVDHKTGKFLHRMIWESFHGPVPFGSLIHHKDHDKFNNDIENLQCMTIVDHVSHHNRIVIDRTCSVEGCDRKYSAKGFCTKHYSRKWYREVNNLDDSGRPI